MTGEQRCHSIDGGTEGVHSNIGKVHICGIGTQQRLDARGLLDDLIVRREYEQRAP